MKVLAKMSQTYAPTLKETPAEAELASHKLLLRAGMIRKTAAGLYSYLPLAWRSLLKIETVIREEMARIGAQEMQVPMITPAELWQESGRWDVYGPELLRVHDRHDRSFCVGPTHEETFTDLIKNEIRSYKQLPVTLYQIQDKFRDEIRPRFGLMRGREFIMKDAYSFDADTAGMQKSYNEQKEAYAKICVRCGLNALPVAADSGQIGGDTSVEFMALADAGEAELVWCECGFAADTEAATVGITLSSSEAGELEKVHTPNCSTIEDLAAYLKVDESATVKALALIDNNSHPVVVFVPGNHEMNDVKASHVFGEYHFMTDDELKLAGLVKGYMGPVNLPKDVTYFADISLKQSEYWIVGANESQYHYLHAAPGRDFAVDDAMWIDVAEAKAGDICPRCNKPLQAARGIEVSQVFQLGTKYSEAMGATFTDEQGNEKPFQMGCYGIGVSRTLAAVVEQHHDDMGIIWPVCVAPYELVVIPLSTDDELVWPCAQDLAQKLAENNIEVILDDRQERPGVKFADADLMGFPYQIILGKRSVEAGNAELKNRETGERSEIPLTEVVDLITREIEGKRL